MTAAASAFLYNDCLMAKLTFLGAAGTVTGSKYLVEAAGKRLLVDCGIFQGSTELSDRNYKPLSIDPKTIDYGRADTRSSGSHRLAACAS